VSDRPFSVTDPGSELAPECSEKISFLKPAPSIVSQALYVSAIVSSFSDTLNDCAAMETVIPDSPRRTLPLTSWFAIWTPSARTVLSTAPLK